MCACPDHLRPSSGVQVYGAVDVESYAHSHHMCLVGLNQSLAKASVAEFKHDVIHSQVKSFGKTLELGRESAVQAIHFLHC